MIHLVCSCGCESWSWSAYDPDPVAADFTRVHEAMDHTVVSKPIRPRKTR